MEKEDEKTKQYLDFGKEIDNIVYNLNQISANFIQAIKSTNNNPDSETMDLAMEDRGNVITQSIKLDVVDENICPMCNVSFQDTKTLYTIFKHRTIWYF